MLQDIRETLTLTCLYSVLKPRRPRHLTRTRTTQWIAFAWPPDPSLDTMPNRSRGPSRSGSSVGPRDDRNPLCGHDADMFRARTARFTNHGESSYGVVPGYVSGPCHHKDRLRNEHVRYTGTSDTVSQSAIGACLVSIVESRDPPDCCSKLDDNIPWQMLVIPYYPQQIRIASNENEGQEKVCVRVAMLLLRVSIDTLS